MDIKTAVIHKCREQDLDDRPAQDQRWCLYTRDGEKLLGRHPSKEKALNQERAIQVSKHGTASVLYRGAVYRRVEAAESNVRAPFSTQRQNRRALIETLVHDLDDLDRVVDRLLTYLAVGHPEPGGWVRFNGSQMSFLTHTVDAVMQLVTDKVGKLKAGL